MAGVIQAAVAVGGGMAAMQQLEQVKFPKLKRADDGAATFKLSVRILGASIPALQLPGLTSQQRPFVELTLGKTKKESEFADYDSRADSAKVGAGASDCPWRFNDTLTFTAKVQDMVSGGIKVALRAKKESVWGFLHFEMAPCEIGEGAVDLQQKVLSSCVNEKHTNGTRAMSWSSPMVLVPLQHVQGGICGEHAGLGEAVAHIACVFTVDSNPEEILAAIEVLRQDRLQRTLTTAKGKLENSQKHVERQVASTMQTIGTATKKLEEGTEKALHTIDVAERRLDAKREEFEKKMIDQVDQKVAKPITNWVSKVENMMTPVDSKAAMSRAQARAGQQRTPVGQLADPDFDPNWVCKLGPNGQVYWHNEALGPAPWTNDEDWQPKKPQGDSLTPEKTLPPQKTAAATLIMSPGDVLKRASNAMQDAAGKLLPVA